MHVEAVYSSNPHSDGIKACENCIMDVGVPSIYISNITRNTNFILTHNCFQLNDESNIHTHGTAMRTKITNTYVNIFMWNYEKRFS